MKKIDNFVQALQWEINWLICCVIYFKDVLIIKSNKTIWGEALCTHAESEIVNIHKNTYNMFTAKQKLFIFVEEENIDNKMVLRMDNILHVCFLRFTRAQQNTFIIWSRQTREKKTNIATNAYQNIFQLIPLNFFFRFTVSSVIFGFEFYIHNIFLSFFPHCIYIFRMKIWTFALIHSSDGREKKQQQIFQ